MLKDKHLLVAVEDCERLERILAGHRLAIPHSVEQAKKELQARQFALVVLGVMFDESRMFELLRLVRTYEVNQLTPVVCVLSGSSTVRRGDRRSRPRGERDAGSDGFRRHRAPLPAARFLKNQGPRTGAFVASRLDFRKEPTA